MRMWSCLWLILAVSCLVAGCVPGLPESAWQAAVKAVCDSSFVPGQNTCQGVRYIGFADLTRKENLFPNLKRTHEYCVVLNYVDFTGELGTAWVQVSGPDDTGDYLAAGGPLFNQACVQIVQGP
jgi:hypothetical protein